MIIKRSFTLDIYLELCKCLLLSIACTVVFFFYIKLTAESDNKEKFDSGYQDNLTSWMGKGHFQCHLTSGQNRGQASLSMLSWDVYLAY